MEAEHVPTYEMRMSRLRLKELAEQHGYSMSRVQRTSGLTMGAVRRYWYNTIDGKANGPRLTLVSLEALDKFAALFNVQPGDLIVPDAADSEANHV